MALSDDVAPSGDVSAARLSPLESVLASFGMRVLLDCLVKSIKTDAV